MSAATWTRGCAWRENSKANSLGTSGGYSKLVTSLLVTTFILRTLRNGLTAGPKLCVRAMLQSLTINTTLLSQPYATRLLLMHAP